MTWSSAVFDWPMAGAATSIESAPGIRSFFTSHLRGDWVRERRFTVARGREYGGQL
jgi:hypothetical protein